ncbi:replication initiation protein, partial [Romboutsia sp.]|uniref:replication initiation protein n=1 Tax=Romboutsia sp. TaxID=1965302 RepID=UPI003F3A1B4C
MKSKKEILLQPNNLIKSKYDFTSIENKLFHKILYNAQKQSSNKPIYHAVIKQEEFKEFIKHRNDCTEENIKIMLNLFQQSILEFDYIDSNGHLKTFGSGLINTYDFNHITNEYEITMHETLYNHITDFISMQGRGYTALNMALLFTFKGAYTQRLYTLVRLWSRQNKEVEVKYTLEEIRNYLKMKPDFYPEYKHFKQNVFKRALKEINEKGNMKIDIKQEIRKGRKVDEIVFSVIDYEPRKYFDKKEKDEIIEIIEENISIDKFDDTTLNIDKNDLKAPVSDFHIINEEMFTKGTLMKFKKDFKHIDFRNKYMEKAFDDALMITLERDDVDDIKASSYKFFK